MLERSFKWAVIGYWVMVSNLFAGTPITSKAGSAGGIFAKFESFLQSVVDFMEGPLAVAAVIVGLVLSLGMWAFAPDHQYLGRAIKVVAAGVFIFSIATLITTL